jgi:uncharacterized protein YecE (DUF72 family)
MSAAMRVGISGWNYEGWRGPFYPKALPHKKELYFASHQFATIEVNGSFYSLQTPSTYKNWYESSPAGFIFSIKAPRFITHIKRLKNAEAPLANFFASGLFELKEKLGPILWQLPPRFLFNADVMENFLSLLPMDLKSASRLAAGADHHLKTPPCLTIDKNRTLRHAMEVRHKSFCNDEFIKLLRSFNVALVMSEGRKEWPKVEAVTANFIYARLHGDKEVYVSGYGPKALDNWASRLKRLCAGKRDIYVYFDNDVKVRAPFDAMALANRLTTFKPATQLKRPNLRALDQIYGPRVKVS